MTTASSIVVRADAELTVMAMVYRGAHLSRERKELMIYHICVRTRTFMDERTSSVLEGGPRLHGRNRLCN